jgi:hypothetical protein
MIGEEKFHRPYQIACKPLSRITDLEFGDAELRCLTAILSSGMATLRSEGLMEHSRDDREH